MGGDDGSRECAPGDERCDSLIEMSWAIRAASLLPTNIFDLTDEGREVLLAGRVSGTSPVHWYGQSPRAIRSMPHPPFVPFTVIVLPSSESPQDYEEWAKSSSLRPTIVAESGGDLSELSLGALQAQFLKVCDRIPNDISKDSINAARKAIKTWKPITRVLPPHHARLRVHRTPGFPCALCLEGQGSCKTSGALRCGNAEVRVCNTSQPSSPAKAGDPVFQRRL
jgi:hypothetical protein